MSWLDQSAIRSSIGAEGGAALRFFGPPIHLLGSSHCLYPLKETRRAGVRRPRGSVSPRAGRGVPRTGLVAVALGGWEDLWSLQLLLGCRAQLEAGKSGRRVLPVLSSSLHAGLAVLQMICALLPHLETALPLSPAFTAKWQLLSYILAHKGRTKWHLTSVYPLSFPNMVFQQCFGYF